MGRLFGADGIRGIALSEVSCEKALLIGKATAYVLSKKHSRRAKILIGKDTRISCNVLESALIAGICSMGADVHTLGVIPTPAVAYLAVKYGADASIMLSAAQNTFEFNGIRLFSASGYSLPEDVEAEIERLVLDCPEALVPENHQELGSVSNEKNAEWDYVRYLLRSIEHDLGRMKIVVDCANGAAYSSADKFFKGLGVNVTLINNTPDGVNINDSCGTADTSALSKAVVDLRAHAGIAFDGDGSRCIIVDEKGEPIDGDRILANLALYMKNESKLASNTCVVTPMTNLGFFKWAKEHSIVVSQTSASDAGCILERMLSDGYSLGGDNSGRVIFGNISTAFDGELCAARMLEIMAKSGKKMSELSQVFTPYPQIIVEVRIRPIFKGRWQEIAEITEMVDFCSEKLSNDGRIMIKESGTEPIIRVMAEGRDRDAIFQYAHGIAQVVRDHIG